jgi:hypothetical protein
MQVFNLELNKSNRLHRMDELTLEPIDERSPVGGAQLDASAVWSALARYWQHFAAVAESKESLHESVTYLQKLRHGFAGIVHFSGHSHSVMAFCEEKTGSEGTSFGRFELGSEHSLFEQIRGVPNLGFSVVPLFKSADIEDERRKSLRMAEHRALLASKLAQENARLRIALDELRRTLETQINPAENESVCLQENYSGIVQEKTHDQVTVTYDMPDGSFLMQTYDVSQFKEGKVPKPGDHLKALVRIEVISPDQEENDEADLDADLGKLRALATRVPIEI